MRILLIPSSYPPVLGGLQTVAHTLGQQLTERGHHVRVVTNRYPRSLSARDVIDGVPVHRWLLLRPNLNDLRRGRLDLFLASFLYYPATLFRLSRLIQQFQPDVVNVHFPDAQVPFVLWLRRRFDFRLVVSLHGHEILRHFGAGKVDDGKSMENGPTERPDIEHLRSALQEADTITACSHYLLDQATSIEPSVAVKGRAIHNGITLSRFEDGAPHAHPRPYVLAYGRLTYQKGFDLLLHAFARVAPSHPEVDLIIAGEGEEQAELEALCRRLSLIGRVRLYGRATPREVLALLNGCVFVVVPSRWEPFGIVALEAMAAGKPVLATRVGGLPEFVGGASNRLVEPTVESLAEWLTAWLGQREAIRALGKLNRTRAAEYTWSRVVDRYLEAYQVNESEQDLRPDPARGSYQERRHA